MSAESQTAGNINLQKQDLSQLDISVLTPLTPEVISRQATINIGTIGHVAHGKSTVVKAISGVHTVRFKNELERNITIKLERMTPELIQELCESPGRLRQYVDELAKKYPRSEFSKENGTKTPASNKRNKRKATSKLNSNRKYKAAKLYDMFGMKEKDAFDQSLLACSMLPLAGSLSTSFASTNDDETSSTTSNQLITHDLSCSAIDSPHSNIELNLQRLCALCKLMHPEIRPTFIPKSGSVKIEEKGVHNEEYIVSKVLQIEFENRPVFHVKWHGYEETSWEPIKNIWDCTAFQKFTIDFMDKWKSKMEQLWNEMVATVSAESLQPKLSDFEAIQQCKQFDYNNFLAHFFVMVRMRNADENPHSKDFKKVMEYLMNDMKHLSYYTQRLNQLQNMKKFQDDINKVDQSKNLHVENQVDLEMPPMEDFTYTNDVIPRNGIEIPNEPPFGCECIEEEHNSVKSQCSAKSNCCPQVNDMLFPYTSKGLLRVPQGTPIFECNKACKCSENCPNRVVQKGRKQTLCIFKTKDRGWGVRTERAIAKGQYICEYVGEIIPYEETERRGKEYDAVGRTYLFDLDFNGKDNPYTVDAAKYGNVSRFINHSCNPNLGVWPVWTDCLDPNLHKLCLFTLRPIKENEELSFDYVNSTNSGQDQTDENIAENITGTSECITTPSNGMEVQDEVVIKMASNDELFIKQEITDEHTAEVMEPIAEESSTDTKKEGFACRCGAFNCRKIIFC